MVGKYDKLIEELPTIAQMMNGTILRDKTVSKAGNTSAVIFVPKFFLGQRVKVIIIPETTEVLGLRKSIDKRDRKLSKQAEKIKGLESKELEEEVSSEVSEVNEDLEGDDAY